MAFSKELDAKSMHWCHVIKLLNPCEGNSQGGILGSSWIKRIKLLFLTFRYGFHDRWGLSYLADRSEYKPSYISWLFESSQPSHSQNAR